MEDFKKKKSKISDIGKIGSPTYPTEFIIEGTCFITKLRTPTSYYEVLVRITNSARGVKSGVENQ